MSRIRTQPRLQSRRRPQWDRRKVVAETAPPGPPVVHITDVERMSQTVLRFSFDTAISDTGGCGDLRVSGVPPIDPTQISDYVLEATYPAMVNGNPWSAHVIDGEPSFVNDGVLADDGGIVPVWA